MARSGALAEQTKADLERDYDRQNEAVAKLDRQLAALETAPAIQETRQVIGGALGAVLAGDVGQRGKIADTLPAVVELLKCRKDGSIRLQWKGARTITWTTELN